jgi:hypothetical protein
MRVRFFGVIFFLVGVAAFVTGIFNFASNSLFKLSSNKATATITDITRNYQDNEEGYTDIFYDIYLEYLVDDIKHSETIHYQNGDSEIYDSMYKGQDITIYYDPNQPNDIRASENTFLSLGIALLGFVLLSMGILIFRMDDLPVKGILGILFVLLGFYLLVNFSIAAYSDMKFAKAAHKQTAIITNVESIATGIDDRDEESEIEYEYFIDLEYTIKDVVYHRLWREYITDMAPGQEIEIYYHPDAPQDIRIISGFTFLGIVITIPFIIIGIILTFQFLKDMRDYEFEPMIRTKRQTGTKTEKRKWHPIVILHFMAEYPIFDAFIIAALFYLNGVNESFPVLLVPGYTLSCLFIILLQFLSGDKKISTFKIEIILLIPFNILAFLLAAASEMITPVFFFILGLEFMLMSYFFLRQEWKKRSECTVLTVATVIDHQELMLSDSISYHPIMKYYVKSQPRTITYANGFPKPLKVRKRVTILYNPKNPDEFCFTKEAQEKIFKIVAVSFILLGIVFWGIGIVNL